MVKDKFEMQIDDIGSNDKYETHYLREEAIFHNENVLFPPFLNFVLSLWLIWIRKLWLDSALDTTSMYGSMKFREIWQNIEIVICDWIDCVELNHKLLFQYFVKFHEISQSHTLRLYLRLYRVRISKVKLATKIKQN